MISGRRIAPKVASRARIPVVSEKVFDFVTFLQDIEQLSDQQISEVILSKNVIKPRELILKFACSCGTSSFFKKWVRVVFC